MLPILIQRYDNISFHFQEWETNWNCTGCQVPYFMSINTTYQFIKHFLDNKMSIFEEYGVFDIHEEPMRS